VNRYSIRYHSRTLAALSNRAKQQTLPLSGWIFNYPNLPNYELTIALSDHVKKADNINLHTGLNVTAHIKADSEEEARDISKNHVETLLNLISFSTLTHCEAATLISIINITDKETCSFSNYVYPFSEQEIIGGLRIIDEATFGTIFEAYDKSSYQPRTLRALTWLRKGIGEESHVDQFISYWTGLEVIKHVLSPERMNTDKEWEEVEKIFENRLDRQDFKKIRQAGRNGLLHGFRELDSKFVKDIGSYVEPIRKTLIFCIGSVLGLEEDTMSSIANKTPRRVEQMPWTVLKGNLENLRRDFNELIRNYPTLEAEITKKQFSISQEGNLKVKFKVTHRFHGTSAVKWTLTETQAWGKKDSGIQEFTLKEAYMNKAKKLCRFRKRNQLKFER